MCVCVCISIYARDYKCNWTLRHFGVVTNLRLAIVMSRPGPMFL